MVTLPARVNELISFQTKPVLSALFLSFFAIKFASQIVAQNCLRPSLQWVKKGRKKIISFISDWATRATGAANARPRKNRELTHCHLHTVTLQAGKVQAPAEHGQIKVVILYFRPRANLPFLFVIRQIKWRNGDSSQKITIFLFWLVASLWPFGFASHQKFNLKRLTF